MTRHRLINIIRRQQYYRPMLAALKECGISEFSILPPSGRGHPVLTFQGAKGAVRIPLPSSPGTFGRHGAAQYIPAEIRRRLRVEPVR